MPTLARGLFFAVADGATESSFADLWAAGLVQGFIESAPDLARLSSSALELWMEPIQRRWREQIRWDKLPWYAEEKARQGAFAALVGLEFFEQPPRPASFWSRWFGARPDERPRAAWRAMAVGDSCLFLIRGGRMLRSFPIETARGFSPRPLLLSSLAERNRDCVRKPEVAAGECEPADLFLLATDALSCWILRQCEAGQRPWERLCAVGSQEDFEGLVAQLRQAEGMKNDDTTLMTLRWPAAAASRAT